MATLTAVEVPGTSDQWRTLGFECHGPGFALAGTAFVVGAERMALAFDALDGDPSPLGVPVRVEPPHEAPPPKHPNGVNGIDHIVYSVPDLDDAIAVLDALLADTPRRRARPRGPQGPEMAFYRVGPAILEVVGGGRPHALGGVAFSSPDLQATVDAIRAGGFESVGDPKPAVQGGFIASVWRGFVGMPIAIMQPRSR